MESWRGKQGVDRTAKDERQDVSSILTQVLCELGVGSAFGLTGGGLARFCDALGRSGIPVIHCRHEGGAGFAAAEAFFASGRPSLVFVTTGPGVSNALTGLLAARSEGAKVILISAATSAASRGRWACQETTAHSMPQGLYEAGPVFDYAVTMENAAQLEGVVSRLVAGLARPGGFVAHVALPSDVQSARVPHLPRGSMAVRLARCDEAILDECARKLDSGSFVIWAGFGARLASGAIRALAEQVGAPVMCSPRAKGIFPESHPLFLGVTGLGGHSAVETYLAHKRPARILVLGTRLGEPTSFWDQRLLPSEELIHVDIDPGVPGTAYPSAKTYAVQAEIGQFVEGLLHRLRPRVVPPPLRSLHPLSEVAPMPRAEGSVRAEMLMAAIQRRVVERSDAVVLTESGNAFAWGNHLLRFGEANRYRVSVAFGSMGHATAGVVGAALGREGKAVAIVGDGSMLMNSEVSTAVQYRAKAVWIVMNDSRYGMVEHGMRALGFSPVGTEMPSTDFVLIARGMGADGVRVEREVELDAALDKAMAADGPFVVDVRTDPEEAGPWLRRIQNLAMQGAQARAGEGA